MTYNQHHPGFELVSLYSFHTMIAIIPRAPPKPITLCDWFDNCVSQPFPNNMKLSNVKYGKFEKDSWVRILCLTIFFLLRKQLLDNRPFVMKTDATWASLKNWIKGNKNYQGVSPFHSIIAWIWLLTKTIHGFWILLGKKWPQATVTCLLIYSRVRADSY